MTATVHVVRHGEVHNPEGVLYGRLPDYHLSELGRAMAERVAATMAGRDVTHLVSSPLERARETIAPTAAVLGLEPHIDERLIEAANVFQGQRFGVGDGALRQPSAWWHLRNPFRPSWGEPYDVVAARMLAAVEDAAVAAEGHEAVLVSHQLPIWTLRNAAQNRRLWHDPRARECSLASVTTLVLDGRTVVDVRYAEPAADLLPVKPARREQTGA
jgi:broad specificity phosphatase PhoE